MHTRNRDKEKTSDHASKFNLWTILSMERASAQPQVNLSLCCSNFLKLKPLKPFINFEQRQESKKIRLKTTQKLFPERKKKRYHDIKDTIG
jgi:hypothetical protein